MTDDMSLSGGVLNPLKRMAVDVLAGWVFLAVFLTTNNIYLATGVGLPIGLGQIVWMISRRQAIEPMQWMATGLVVVLGGATILFHNPTFAVFKPSIFEGCLAAMMLRPGWTIRYAPARARALLPRGLMLFWGYLWSAAWFALAASNLFVARVYGLRAWAIYTNISPLALLAVLFGSGMLIFPPLVRRIARQRGVSLAAPPAVG
jgi:intracellular septation protein A